jgi:putative endonuclease
MGLVTQEERGRRGRLAEGIATAYLELTGWEIAERNLRSGGGEIDIVAIRGDWLVFFEVRFRSDVGRGTPVETVTGRKSRALARAARAYFARSPRKRPCWRFDVIAVTLRSGAMDLEVFPGVVALGC